MSPHKICRILLSIPLLCLIPLGHAEEWPVKKFEVFLGPPTVSALTLGNSVDGWGVSAEELLNHIDGWVDVDSLSEPPSNVDLGGIADLETYLEEIANTLESQGFKPPDLGPIVRGRSGEPVYRVYYHAFPSSHRNQNPARYTPSQCGAKRPIIEVNANKMLAGRPTLSPKNYQDLAHELFHSVQASYPLFIENCGRALGKWIGEGTAQALGADLAAYSTREAEIARPASGSDWFFHRWGFRAYDRALTARRVIPSAEYEAMRPGVEKAANVDYGASSFWRYLGETAASNGAAGTRPIKPDYSYLQVFFNSDIGGQPGWSREADWLAEQIDASPAFKLPLDRLYPQFIATYVAYLHTRFSSRASRADAIEGYLSFIFPETGCPIIRLSDHNPVSRMVVKIEPLAAACLRLDLAFSYATDIEISIDSKEQAGLEALYIGTQDGRVVSKPNAVDLGGRREASSIFNVPVNLEPVIFTITNIGKIPGATEPVELMVRVAPSWNSHNLAPQGPTPPTPPPSGNTGGGEPVTAESQREHVNLQVQEGLKNLNPNTAHGNTVKRSPDSKSCADPFVIFACGPSTSISLSMVPGMYGSFIQSTGRGGMFGQFASALSGVAASDPAAHQAQLREMVEFSESIDGAEVTMVIPLIDYGFTGTFNNAFLEVSARGRKTFRAIGPADIQPGPGQMFPLSGRVTIDEYTPNVLRGSYSGRLVDTDRIVAMGEDDPLPIHETISGRFQIVAAWRGDSRASLLAPEDPAESVRLDLAQMLPGLDSQAVNESIHQEGGSQSSNTRSSTVATGRSNLCDCSCNQQEEASEPCQAICASTYTACMGLTAPATPASALIDKVVQKKDDNMPFLRTIPNACDVLGESAASSLLAAHSVELIGPREYIPKVTSQCAYRDVSAPTRKAQVTMLFASLLVYDSRNQPLDKLRLKVGGIRSHETRATLVDGVGYKTFAMMDGDTASLVALTGIYGTGAQSDDFVSELVVTFNLTDATRTPPELMMALIGVARLQLAGLQKIATTTHEGAAVK